MEAVWFKLDFYGGFDQLLIIVCLRFSRRNVDSSSALSQHPLPKMRRLFERLAQAASIVGFIAERYNWAEVHLRR